MTFKIDRTALFLYEYQQMHYHIMIADCGGTGAQTHQLQAVILVKIAAGVAKAEICRRTGLFYAALLIIERVNGALKQLGLVSFFPVKKARGFTPRMLSAENSPPGRVFLLRPSPAIIRGALSAPHLFSLTAGDLLKSGKCFPLFSK